jgi:hypothetical protein
VEGNFEFAKAYEFVEQKLACTRISRCSIDGVLLE